MHAECSSSMRSSGSARGRDRRRAANANEEIIGSFFFVRVGCIFFLCTFIYLLDVPGRKYVLWHIGNINHFSKEKLRISHPFITFHSPP
jgi:hypothetical protein